MAFGGINIINVPSDLGSIYAGKSHAPAAFRDAGLQDKLEGIGAQVSESTALSGGLGGWVSANREPNGARNEGNTVEACHKVRDAVSRALSSGSGTTTAPKFQLIVGGECLFCPPILSAFWKDLERTGKRVGMIYMDADCDLSTPAEPTSSGNIAGMTLTHLTLREGALDSMKPFSRPDGSGVVDSSNIVLFGLNIDSSTNKLPHLGYLFDNHYRVITSQAVQANPAERAKVALTWLEERVDFLLVHLDVDMIDPGLFPLANVPSWTGLGFHESMAALKIFLKSSKCVGLSVAEVNPDHDPGLKMTEQLIDEIVEGLSEKTSLS